jgi:hypothetical protein
MEIAEQPGIWKNIQPPGSFNKYIKDFHETGNVAKFEGSTAASHLAKRGVQPRKISLSRS